MKMDSLKNNLSEKISSLYIIKKVEEYVDKAFSSKLEGEKQGLLSGVHKKIDQLNDSMVDMISSTARLLQILANEIDVHYESFFIEDPCNMLVFSEKGILITMPRYRGNRDFYPALFTVYIDGVRQTYSKRELLDCQIKINHTTCEVEVTFPYMLEEGTFVEIFAKKQINLSK